MCTPSPCSLATKRAPAHFSCSTRQPGAKSGARSRTTDSICSCSRPGSRSSSVTRPPVALRSAANALHEAQRASRLTAVAVPGDTTISSHRAVAAKTSAGSMSQRKERDVRQVIWQVSGHARLIASCLPAFPGYLFRTKHSHTSTHFDPDSSFEARERREARAPQDAGIRSPRTTILGRRYGTRGTSAEPRRPDMHSRAASTTRGPDVLRPPTPVPSLAHSRAVMTNAGASKAASSSAQAIFLEVEGILARQRVVLVTAHGGRQGQNGIRPW